MDRRERSKPLLSVQGDDGGHEEPFVEQGSVLDLPHSESFHDASGNWSVKSVCTVRNGKMVALTALFVCVMSAEILVRKTNTTIYMVNYRTYARASFSNLHRTVHFTENLLVCPDRFLNEIVILACTCGTRVPAHQLCSVSLGPCSYGCAGWCGVRADDGVQPSS